MFSFRSKAAAPPAPRAADRPPTSDDIARLERSLTDARAEAEAGRADVAAAKAEVQGCMAFLAHASHEIRTPLSGLLGITQVLLATDLTPEQEELSRTLASSGEGLLGLLNNVLDFSRLEAGGVLLEPAPFDVTEVVEEALGAVASMAAGKGIDLAFVVDPALPERFVGDAMRVGQVLVNLLANAVKFTERGEVVVRLTGTAGSDGAPAVHLRFAVEDTGVGIAAGRLPGVFRPFVQGEASTARRYGGSGLGLALSRRMAERMGGALTAESVEGRGSTFVFEAPFPVAVPPQKSGTLLLAGRRVLVAAAHGPLRTMAAGYLTRVGVEVHEAASAAAAHALLGRVPFDAALLDADLGAAAGARLLHLVRGHPDGAALPCIELHPLGQRPEGAPGPTLACPLRRAALYSALSALLRDARPAPRLATLAPPAPPAEEAPAGPRVLLVEDNDVNRRVAEHLLQRLGVTAAVATNGWEAVEAVSDARYDLVLMDVMMPVMDGLDAARHIRTLALGAQPRIVALTANALPGDRQRCLDAGMDDYLAKPLRLHDLTRVLGDAVPPALAGATGAAPAPGPSPLDHDVLRELRAMIGVDDAAFLDALIEDFLTDADALVSAIGAGIAAADLPTVRRAAHTLKSSSGMLGARALSARCDAIETAAEAGDPAGTQAAAAGIDAAFEAVRAALEPMRERQTAGF